MSRYLSEPAPFDAGGGPSDVMPTEILVYDLECDRDILEAILLKDNIRRVGIIFAKTVVWLSPLSAGSWRSTLGSFRGNALIELRTPESNDSRQHPEDSDLMKRLQEYESDDTSILTETELRKRSRTLSGMMKLFFGYKCMFCSHCIETSSKPYVESHHIFPLGKGGRDVPSNIAIVCPNCHAEFHHGRAEKVSEMRSRFYTVNPFSKGNQCELKDDMGIWREEEWL